MEGILSERLPGFERLQRLHLWTAKAYVVALIEAGQLQLVSDFISQAIWLYESDNELENLSAFLNENFSALKLNCVNDSRGFTRRLLAHLFDKHLLHDETNALFEMWLPQARYDYPF